MWLYGLFLYVPVEKESKLCIAFSCKSTCLLFSPSWPPLCLPKATSPNMIILRAWIFTYKFWKIKSISNAFSIKKIELIMPYIKPTCRSGWFETEDFRRNISKTAVYIHASILWSMWGIGEKGKWDSTGKLRLNYHLILRHVQKQIWKTRFGKAKCMSLETRNVIYTRIQYTISFQGSHNVVDSWVTFFPVFSI